jgi:hypothetical protein
MSIRDLIDDAQEATPVRQNLPRPASSIFFIIQRAPPSRFLGLFSPLKSIAVAYPVAIFSIAHYMLCVNRKFLPSAPFERTAWFSAEPAKNH